VGVGTGSRRVAALVVLVAAAAFLVSPTRAAPPTVHPFGTATRDRPPADAPGPADVVRPPAGAPRPTVVGPRPARSVGEAFGAYVGDSTDLAPLPRYEAALGLPPGETLGSVLRYAAGGGRGGW
jgi:hypothetical protein